MSLNNKAKQLELFKDKLNQQQVDLSNGLSKIGSQLSEWFPKIQRLQKVKVFHLQRNQNPRILIQIQHIQFHSLKRLILQSNKILNLEPIRFLDFPNLQELDLLRNKISSFRSIANSNLSNLKTLKISIDTVNHAWNHIYRSQNSIKFMLLESFYTKNNPITFSKLHNLAKQPFIKDLYFKNNQKQDSFPLLLYLKDYKVRRK